MNKADEMFKELEYELHYEDEYSFSLFNKEKGRFITFMKNTKTLLLSSNVTMQELQAINKKVKELRMELIDLLIQLAFEQRTSISKNI